MPKKAEIDLTITGALDAVHEFFFDVEKTIEKVTENEPVEREDRDDKPEPKPTKRVGNTFVAKKAGQKEQRRESSDGAPDMGGSGSGKDEPDDAKE